MSDQPITPTPEVFPDWHDPFVEPQTIPDGWDLSAMRLDAAPVEDEAEDDQTRDQAIS